MRAPDGAEHPMKGVFREVVEPERLVFTWGWANEQWQPTSPETTVTVTLEDLGGKTRLTLQQRVFESITARDVHRGGWTGSLERLADYLATL